MPVEEETGELNKVDADLEIAGCTCEADLIEQAAGADAVLTYGAQMTRSVMEKLPDFRRGYLDDGLSVEEYAGFGPVQLFRNSFVKSWTRIREIIEERRARL